MQPGLDLELIHNTIRPFIKRQRYGVIASISSTGNPQSAVVGIAITDEIEVIFDTLSATRKYRNLTTNPRCSMVFFDGEKTLQFDGLVFEPRGADLSRYQDAYFSTWPECREHTSWPGIAYLVARPDWVRFSDFDQRPPFVRELQMR